MTEAAARSGTKSRASDESAISKLAKQTQAEPDVVRTLYEQEVEALGNKAAVKGFIGIVAARRVRQRLLSAARQVRQRLLPARKHAD
jgi:hypothetical protein